MISGRRASAAFVVAGVPGVGGRREDGLPATETWLSMPQDVAIGKDGVWWIADYNNHLVREVDVHGIARTVAGSGFPGGGDGGPALQEPFDHPTMALQDPADPELLWIAATGNHRIALLRRSAGWIPRRSSTRRRCTGCCRPARRRRCSP